MSERREPSREQKPFDSRRAARVSVVTPRNPVPAPPSSAPIEEEDEGRPAGRDEVADSR